MSEKHANALQTKQKKLDSYKEQFDMVADVLRGDNSAEDKIRLIEGIVDIDR
jgi:hypothetical protein